MGMCRNPSGKIHWEFGWVAGSAMVTLGVRLPKCILIVDDSSAVRNAVRSFLEESGFEVCGEAVDGHDAIQKAKELNPDLIILDFAMPRMNGIEAALILKQIMPETPILLLTSHSAALQDRGALLRSIDAVVPKDGGLSVLLRYIDMLIQVR
jgi:DNA-binding NarL/FixJ family response regulator